jgi:hypothetical protein
MISDKFTAALSFTRKWHWNCKTVQAQTRELLFSNTLDSVTNGK